mgnify:CR=1 FL=1
MSLRNRDLVNCHRYLLSKTNKLVVVRGGRRAALFLWALLLPGFDTLLSRSAYHIATKPDLDRIPHVRRDIQGDTGTAKQAQVGRNDVVVRNDEDEHQHGKRAPVCRYPRSRLSLGANDTGSFTELCELTLLSRLHEPLLGLCGRLRIGHELIDQARDRAYQG